MYGYRVYQLFRTFWVQNTLACFIGGALCLGLFLTVEMTLSLTQFVNRSQKAFYIQILPQTSDGIVTNELLMDLRKQFPEIKFQARRETKVLKGVATSLDVSQGMLDTESPLMYIVGHPKHTEWLMSEMKNAIEAMKAHKLIFEVDAQIGYWALLTLYKRVGWGGCIAICLGFIFFLYYIIQFILSQLIRVRRHELRLEYLLGATKVYQKRPYTLFIFFYMAVSLCIASMVWFLGFLPLKGVWDHFGFLVTSINPNPGTLLVFGLLFSGIVWSTFQWVWRYHFSNIMAGKM